jgi:hypothetical protein
MNSKELVPLSERYFLWGLMLLLATLVASLSSYYLYSPVGRQFAFALMIVSLVMLFWSMAKDLEAVFKYKWVAWFVVFALVLIYFLQRMELPRYDFSVGDPSDYFIAGVCSVTYSQDIGFFMPLTASITALGYEVFGIALTPLVNVILYAASIPLSYFVFKKLTSSMPLSLIMSTFLVFIPVSILFSKTSFTEPTWQTLLIIFSINAYYTLANKKLAWQNIIIFYLILFLAPFLRGEGVVYYGLVLFLVLYHYWKYTNFKSMLWLAMGTVVLAGTVHLTLAVRSNYLLNMQFSRVIPNITEFQLMSILYGAAGLAFTIVLILYLVRNKYKNLSMPMILVGLSILFKVGVSYLYSTKKNMSVMELLFINEYDLAVGNFGVLITLLIIIGLVLLYIRAIKGDSLALMLVMLYAVFHLSYVMQAVTFYDIHAMFLYWNRYYLSVFMMVHLFALGLALKLIYQSMERWIEGKQLRNGIFGIFLALVVFFSMNGKMYEIAITEAHHKDSYKFFEWLKEKVERHPFAVVLDSSIVYKQNIEHIGLNDIKYMTSRTFSIYKMNVKGYQRVKPENLNANLKYNADISKVRYVLCMGEKDYHLENKTLTKIEEFRLPLEWREHFGLDDNDSSIHQGDVTKSIVEHVDFHATLYRVDKKLILGKKIAFKSNGPLASNMLKEGWTFINNRSSAFASDGKGIILLPKIQKSEGNEYSITLRYAIINANDNHPKIVTFQLADKLLETVTINSHTTREIELVLPNTMLPLKLGDIEMTMESSNEGQIMLRSIIINKKGK